MPYDAERRALLADLERAFDPGTFERAYPGMTAPGLVSIGGNSDPLAFEVIVWPFPQSVSNEHRTAGPCAAITTEFDLVVGLVASGADDADASSVCLAYLDCVQQVCMADPTLHGLVDRARPVVGQGGGGTDSDFGFTYGMNVRISCRRDIQANKAIERAVREVA